jgi:WD40 repeat protein
VGREGDVKVWDSRTGKELAVPFRWTWPAVDTSLATLDPEGRFAVVSAEGLVRWVDVSSRRVVEVVWGRQAGPMALAAAPDGRSWASSALDTGAVAVWSVAPMHIQTFAGHTGQVYGIALSRDGKLLASASGDSEKGDKQVCEVKLWDLRTGQERANLDQQPHGFYAVDFSPDGALIAASSGRGQVKVFDVQTGQEKAAWQAHAGWARCLAFTPQGKELASGGADGKVQMWDTAGKPGRTFAGHAGIVNSIAFSSDGKLLVVGSGVPNLALPIGQVKLWDVATGQELAELKGHTDRVFAVAFSPDNQTIVSVAFDVRPAGAAVGRADAHAAQAAGHPADRQVRRVQPRWPDPGDRLLGVYPRAIHRARAALGPGRG